MNVVFPPLDAQPWPTLGPQVCAFIESYLVHGPGDLLGQPFKLTPELRGWLYRMYEVHPPKLERRKGGVIVYDTNPLAGRRRFHRCALSLRKGSAKTEIAAVVAAVELHPEGPVRCDGFVGDDPMGRPVVDPYIPMISYSEEQTEELAYGALKRMLEESPLAGHFDIGLNRIMRLDGHGKAEAVSASPNARDGARTTFQHADETHRFVSEKLKGAWQVMLANTAKRGLGAQPWSLETTTAYEPGALSVAESTHHYATKLLKAPHPERAQMFFYHRQASEPVDITKRSELRRAIVEASGPFISKWTDVDRIAAGFEEPDADAAYLKRVWLNIPTEASGIAFDMKQWGQCATEFTPPDGDAITLGFCGDRYEDGAALVATHQATGYQWPVRIWERPDGVADWGVPTDEVNGAVDDVFSRWYVTRFYANPQKWESYTAQWAGTYDGKRRRVFDWETSRRKPFAYAIGAYLTAIAGGELTHNGNALLADHFSAARRVETTLIDEETKRPLWLIRPERPGRSIMAAKAAVLSWEARNDAIAAGEGVEAEPEYEMVFL